MKHAPLLALVCVLALEHFATACTSPIAPAQPHTDDADDDVAEDDSQVDMLLPASQYCATVVDFFCDFYLRCGRMAANSHAECHSVFMESCQGRYQPQYVALQQAGLLNLSHAGVQACSQHLQSVHCDQQPLDLNGPCETMWPGSQSLGGACSFDIESFVCSQGTRCSLNLSLCGTCKAVAEAHEFCDGDVVCKADARCVDNQCAPRAQLDSFCSNEQPCLLGYLCIEGSCQPRPFSTLNAPCDAYHRCPYWSQCVDGVCRRSALIGEACSANLPCETGFCEVDTCASLRSSNAPCTTGLQCISGRCIDSACAAVPTSCFAPP